MLKKTVMDSSPMFGWPAANPSNQSVENTTMMVLKTPELTEINPLTKTPMKFAITVPNILSKKIFLVLTAIMSILSSCSQDKKDAPPPALIQYQTSFYGDWESGTVIGKGNKNWGYLESMAPDRFTLVNDGIRKGTYARVEVRNGDNPLTFCCAGTERAEVSAPQTTDNKQIFENLSSGTQRYSFSVKFDTSWQNISESKDANGNPDGKGKWGIFLQLHGPGANFNGNIKHHSPALAFSATDQIRFSMLVGDLSISEKSKLNNLSNGSLNKGKWIDFILTVKYAKDNSGSVNIMRRDEGETIFTEVFNLPNTPTLHYHSGADNKEVGNHYWKHGLYRNQQDFTSILYLDGFIRQSR